MQCNIRKKRSLSSISQQRFIDVCFIAFQTLIDINQGLLSSCKVSHPSLDRICLEAKKHGLSGKLTGAGGGGYAYILLLPDTSTQVISDITKELAAFGCSTILVDLGGAGLQIAT